jgi:long-chain acyl-CoA synthetase
LESLGKQILWGLGPVFFFGSDAGNVAPMVTRRTIAHLAHESTTRFGPRTMVRRSTPAGWVSLTFAEMASLRERICAGLHARGIAKGDRVAVLCSTRLEWATLDAGAMALGAVVVGIYPTLTPDQILYILKHSSCRALFIENSELYARLDGLLGEAEDLALVGLIEGETPDGVVGYAELLAAGEAALAEDPELVSRLRDEVRPEDMATLVYTSGTTGDPKGAVLNHGALFDTAKGQAEVAQLTDEDVGVAFLPMAHVLGRVAGYSAGLAGVQTWFSPSIEAAPDTWQVARPTTMALVPRVFEKMHAKIMAGVAEQPARRQAIFGKALAVGLERSRAQQAGRPVPLGTRAWAAVFERLVYSKLRVRLFGGRVRAVFSGGAPCSKELLEFFHALGILVLEGYGLTETCSPTHMNRPDDFKFGTVGRPLPGVEVRIADDGEILVKTPGLFAGYFRNDEATKEAIDDEGWFHTGDIGEVDAQGFLKITDRKKDIIITAGGKNVAPQNIENLIKQDPAISQVMVYGDEKPYLVALVTLDAEALGDTPRDEAERRVAAAVERANATLAKYETIKKHHVLDEEFSVDNGMLTPSLKVKRRVVRDRFKERIEGLYAG